jgi:SAM-dependent methyltransferase
MNQEFAAPSVDPFRQFYQHRWALNYGDTEKKETPKFWDERAADFAAKAHSGAARRESEEFLQRFAWKADETVLDVAAGPGTFAVPLAKKVALVTATDFSAAMLEQLRLQATKENAGNINIVAGRWLELDSLQPHDTVLCLNSLGVISVDAGHKTRLEDTLHRLNSACKKRLIVLIPHADSPLEPQLRLRLRLESASLERRRVAILYYAMVDCGMLPDLQIIRRPFRWTFSSANEAVETLLIKAGLENTAEVRHIISDYLQDRLIKDDSGRFSLAYDVAQALFVWQK